MYRFVHVDGKFGSVMITFIGHSVNLGLDDIMAERCFLMVSHVLCIS